jgi:hypothetical protein
LARNILGSNAAFPLFFTSTISHTKSVKSLNYIAIPTPKYNRAGVTLPRFTSQIFTTAARGCSNFNNLRKAAAGRVVTTLEFSSGQFCCWTGNLGEQF